MDAFYCTNTSYQNETYKIEGEACKGKEKLKKLQEHFGGEPYRIVEAYSDEPEEILEEAEKAYILKPDGQVREYKS